MKWNKNDYEYIVQQWEKEWRISNEENDVIKKTKINDKQSNILVSIVLFDFDLVE